MTAVPVNRFPIALLLLPGILLLSSSANAENQKTTDNMGRALYPSQHGAPLGHPGCFDEQIEVTDKDTGETTLKPKYPVWGHPELQNYPGSVEHFRPNSIKYLPAINAFNERTLVANHILADRPNAKTEPYAEPIYYMPMYGSPIFTEKHRAPINVHRLGRSHEDIITLNFGKLPQGMYAIRAIGAIPVEPKDWTTDPEVLVLTATLNDAADGNVRSYTRRHRAVDQFYAVGEWYVQVHDDREVKFTLKLEPESEVDLLIHNIDIHNVLAGIPFKPIKTKATVYTSESREAAQAYYVEHGEVSRQWGANSGPPREKGIWQGEPLSADARAERDDILWNAVPPEVINLQTNSAYGKFDQYNPPAERVEEIGEWKLPFATRYNRNWDQPRKIVNEKLGLEYTVADYLAAKPLPSPYPYQDRGYGYHVDGEGYHNPVQTLLQNHDANYLTFGHPAAEVGNLCIAYYNRNDLAAARDAAIILIRNAYTSPSMATEQKRDLQQVVCRPAQCFGFNDPVHRRFTGNKVSHVIRLARVYDLLFDYIKDNDELAQAAGRYIPTVKTSDDLRAFLDQRILGWGIQQITDHRVTSSHGTPTMAIEMAILADNPTATQPLMEYLFTRTWDYPLPLSGVQDYMITGTTRDGTTTIGSFMYTVGGSPFLNVASQLDAYIANGGDKKYDLSDLKRYPKPFFGAYFNLDARVAGYWPVGVGDVGGLMRPANWFTNQEDAVRKGWQAWRDPKLAWILTSFFGRKHESNAQWSEIEAAASQVDRNPWMANKSRVLSTWAGILEGGTEHDDVRFRKAVTMRVGVGWGHSHRDTLDLQIHALGCQMTPDGGQRPGYGRPDCITTMNHNVVEVDGNGNRNDGNWEGTAWIRTLADLPGSAMMHAKAIPPMNKQQVRLHERTAVMIDVDPGTPSNQPASDEKHSPGTVYGKDAVLPSMYVFDVSRVAGGQRHTYGFHGNAEDEFTINALNKRDVPLAHKAEENDADAAYLRKYVVEGSLGAGDTPDTLIATWRMGREKYEFETASGNIDEGKVRKYVCGAPEPMNLGANYDPEAPRKFTRLHLLGQEGARARWGRWVSAPYTSNHGKWFTQLHVMQDGEADRESVFPAIIETYAGTPAVKQTQLVPVMDNEDDALRAVAVHVQTTNGRDDLLFVDGRPGKHRVIAGGLWKPTEASAQFAYVSRDKDGLRQASIVAGSSLHNRGLVTIKPERANYEATITKVEHLNRWFEVDTVLPEPVRGHAFWEVGNDDHATSLEVTKVEVIGSKSRVHFRKGLELVCTRVKDIDMKTGVVTGKLVSILMGAAEDNQMKPGMLKGLWATNDAMDKWWQCEYVSGSRADGYQYKLTGNSVTEADFPINGALRIFEMGPSDTARLAGCTTLRRDPNDAGKMQLISNVACEVTIQGKSNKQVMKSFTASDVAKGAVTIVMPN